MKASLRWLQEFFPAAATDIESVAAALTARGVESEAAGSIAAARGVCAARIVKTEPHPRAEKLQICSVDFGGGQTAKVVCGASNARAGLVTAYARGGAELPGGAVQNKEVRGEKSAGMLCSAAELGAAADDSGILELPSDCAPGAALRELLLLEDSILEAATPPNRGDVLSHLGLARELATCGGADSLSPPSLIFPETDYPIKLKEQVAAALRAPKDCPRYCSVVIRGAAPSAPSPLWLQTRLWRCGLRPIGAAVDVTNYVMLSLGQPLHAFDLARLRGGIVVRRAKRGEAVELLNGQRAVCGAQDLLICDDGGARAVAMAGVMGGANSAVSESTCDILLEAAHFAPRAVRGRARRLKVESDAAFRFERGVDPELPARALAMAARLILKICGGEAGPVNSTTSEKHLPRRRLTPVSITRARKVLGVADIRAEQAAAGLLAQGILVKKQTKNAVWAAPPSWRFDLEIFEDFVEEIARGYGYEKLPDAMLTFTAAPGAPPRVGAGDWARDFFAARGWREILTYPFIDAAAAAEFSPAPPVKLANPLAENMAALRGSLLAGLADRAAHNLQAGAEGGRLFEVGRCFFPRPADSNSAKTLPQWAVDCSDSDFNTDSKTDVNADDDSPFLQPLMAAGIMFGAAHPAQWGRAAANADFYDIKGAVEEAAGGRAEFSPPQAAKYPAMHPEKCAEIVINGRAAGVAGEMHPALAKARGFETAPVMFEFLPAAVRPRRAALQPVVRFPRSRRDIALLVDEDAPAAAVLAAAAKTASQQAAAAGARAGADLFDFYRGEKLPKGKKSLGVRVWVQGVDKNLIAADIAAVVKKIEDALRAQFGGEVR